MLAVALAAGVVLVGPAGAESADPIVGTWRFGAGTVQVSQRGNALVGRVVAPMRLAVCPHGSGESMWRLAASGRNYYRGTHLSFDDRFPGCGDRVKLAASWSLLPGGRLVLRVAELTGHSPGACGSFETLCFTLTRAGSAASVPGIGLRLAGLGGETLRGTTTAGLVLERGGDRTSLEVTGVRTQAGDTVLMLAVARSTAVACAAGSTGTLRLSGHAAVVDICRLRTELRGTTSSR